MNTCSQSVALIGALLLSLPAAQIPPGPLSQFVANGDFASASWATPAGPGTISVGVTVNRCGTVPEPRL